MGGVARIAVACLCFGCHALREKGPGTSDVDDFLNSLELDEDPVQLVNNAHLPQTPTHNNAPLNTEAQREQEAILTLETVRDREEEMHVSEAHRMKCDEVLRNSGKIGEARQGSYEDSALIIGEDLQLYGDTNDDDRRDQALLTNSNTPSLGDASNGHEEHTLQCHRTKSHSVRKVAMVGDLDLPPFFQKLGEFEIEGVMHDNLDKDEDYIKVFLSDPDLRALHKCRSCSDSQKKKDGCNWCYKFGYGLDTILPDGTPYECGPADGSRERAIACAAGKPAAPLRKWVITSKTWDKEVKPKMEQIAQEVVTAKKEGAASGMHHEEGLNCDNVFDNTEAVDFTVEMGCILKAIEGQEKFVPFNHKLEKAQLEYTVCKGRGMLGRFSCRSMGSLYIHDGKLVLNSADEALLDWVVASTDKNADNLQGYLKQPGLMAPFENSKRHMQVKGSIKWDVTLSKKGHCTPAMQPIVYVGIGADEDPNDDSDDVDLDLGTVLYSWTGSHLKKEKELYYGQTGQKPGQIFGGRGDFQVRRCEMVGSRGNHRPSSERTRNCVWTEEKETEGYSAMVEYSGDNLDGSGEGDDEFIAYDLDKLWRAGITHIVVVVNIYTAGQTFGGLDGAFFRSVVSGRGEKNWATAQTTEYVDLDEMKSARTKNAAIIAAFFVDHMKDILLPNTAVKANQKEEVMANTKLQDLIKRFKAGTLSDAEKRELATEKLKLTQNYEVVPAKYPVPCSSSQCSLPKSLDGIERFLKDGVGSVLADHSKVTSAVGKANDANSVIAHDLDVSSNPSVAAHNNQAQDDIDDFLDSLDDMIPANDQLALQSSHDAIGTGTVALTSTAEGQAEFQKGLLVEFPGGPPGSDTLCLPAVEKVK